MSTDETAPAPVAEEGDSTRRAGCTKTPKFKIEKTKLLLVEGKDEDLFFTSALEKHLGIGSIQVLPLAGKEQLSRNLAALKRDPKFVEVTSLAVIRDADNAADAAFQSVCGALRRHDFMPPDAHAAFSSGWPRAGIFIMPDGQRNGMLETLCMDSVAGSVEAGCLRCYFNCLGAQGVIPRPFDKARAQAWLASRPQPDKRVGEAAAAGYWPFNNAAFDSLWNFIRST